jgi:acetylornithine deacetylase/succinyl-diaminopimelate desuccinylase-like protein
MEEILKEEVEVLQNLIKINTTNPPGNELPACKYLKSFLEKEKIDCEILTSQENRGNLIAKISANNKKEKPLLLLSHLDVVPAEEEKWEIHPFSGELKDGFIWGRGALDCKGLVVKELFTLILLKRKNIKLKRDVIFAATADEEKGGEQGLGYLINNHFEKISAEYALNEGGGFSIYFRNKNYYFLQNAEKGLCWLKIKIKGTPGHASTPHLDNPVIHISNIIKKITSYTPPLKFSETTEKMFEEIISREKFPNNLILKILKFSPILKYLTNLKKSPKKLQETGFPKMLFAMFHNTLTPTIVKGGYKVNIIPSEAEVEVDCRILPGETKESFLKTVKDLLKNFSPEIEVTEYHPATFSPLNTELYEIIKDVVSHYDNSSVILPFMQTGATDSRFLRMKNIISYGFEPMKIDLPYLEYLNMVHGHNERVSLKNLSFGTEVLFEIVKRFCTL